MFEYLMPPLVMRAPMGSLLDQTDRLVVRRQIDYGAKLGLPWGVSESAYNARDLEFTYQYSNFGVPSLGLKRGSGENKVIAPYATALATMVDPAAAVANFLRLTTIGARGRFGFYEAVDFTPTRIQEGESFALVRASMAHHQGMTIVAIAIAVFSGLMRERFHAEPIIQATNIPSNSTRIAPRSRDATGLSRRRSKYSSRPKTTPKFDASPSPMGAGEPATSRSLLLRTLAWTAERRCCASRLRKAFRRN